LSTVRFTQKSGIKKKRLSNSGDYQSTHPNIKSVVLSETTSLRGVRDDLGLIYVTHDRKHTYLSKSSLFAGPEFLFCRNPFQQKVII